MLAIMTERIAEEFTALTASVLADKADPTLSQVQLIGNLCDSALDGAIRTRFWRGGCFSDQQMFRTERVKKDIYNQGIFEKPEQEHYNAETLMEAVDKSTIL